MANPNPKTEHLAAWQFKKGQISNPNGRAGGKSLKERVKERLANMSDEELDKYLEGLNKIDVWKMGEGNPTNETELKGKLTISQVLDGLEKPK